MNIKPSFSFGIFDHTSMTLVKGKSQAPSKSSAINKNSKEKPLNSQLEFLQASL